MFSRNDYQLNDFGNSRRLERFGEITLDRPCPAAEHLVQADPAAWQTVDARFESVNEQEGQWICRRELPDRWNIAHGDLRFGLKRTPFGHLGLFPEQAENWDWIGARVQGSGFRVQKMKTPPLPTTLRSVPGEGQGEGIGEGGRLKILNLFAYTGGSTLAAAAAGAAVVHVDAARNIVDWARHNAELSGLANAPIHWITEDAMKFVKREIKRGNTFDAVILDPPSYGHGRRGEVWRLSKHLPRLLSMCAELTAGQCRFVLLTCHTPGYESERLADMMKETMPDTQSGVIDAKTLTLRSVAGRELPSGIVVRWMTDSI
jgi:23S rRNA (cytosine1962-C5)-methyltransferase